MPEIHPEVALEPRMIQFSLAPAYQPSRTPDQRHRRSIYAYRVRGQPDPFLEVLHRPTPNESCERREATAVTPQVFSLLNSELVEDRAIAFALRLEREAESLEAQIDRAFRLTLGRPGAEAARSSDSETTHSKCTRTTSPTHRRRLATPTRITRSLVEEFSGKPFEYTEWLAVFEDYVPDAKPWTVSPATRALADVCIVLFNSNEWIHVY